MYTEGNKATDLYIIYNGVFKLQKKNLSGQDEIDRADLTKTKLYTILKLDQGDFAGIESIMNVNRYKYTLIVLCYLI